MNHKYLFKSVLVVLALLAVSITACKKDDPEPADNTDPNLPLKQEILSNYADIVYATYQDSYTTAVELKNKIDAFVASPSATTLQEAKDAWLAAREPYGQSEGFRFASGPIDDADGPEGSLNSWPLDENYVDYVIGAPTAGIINDVTNYPTIDKATLIAANQASGVEENVSIGYHAIEFLLWGQDTSATGAGARAYTDYVVGGTADNQTRRGEYLKACAEILLDDLQALLDEWAPGSTTNYRHTFTNQSANEGLRQMLTGIGVLSKSELAGERIFTAYDNQDQEDEHSCFSDNTHRDIITNTLSIQNVYTGSYQRVDGSTVSGSSVADLIALIDASTGTTMTTNLADSWTKVNAIYTPFDQAIVLSAERPKVLEAVNALQAQGDQLVVIASKLGITISTDLPG